MLSFLCILWFAALTHAANLTCQFDGTPTSACYNFTLSVITSKNEAIEVPGSPFTPYTDNKTTGIWLTRHARFEVQEFPSQIFKIFTNIQTFVGKNFSMTELETDSFFNCKNLDLIEFQFSDIKHIREGFARTCSEIYEIKILKSFLLSIDEKAFEGLTSLRILSIVESSLKFISTNLFQNLPKLKRVDLDRNQIEFIPNLNLYTTGNHEENLSIQLRDNPIKTIHPLLLTFLYSGRNKLSPVRIDFHPTRQRKTSTCIDFYNQPHFAGDLYAIGGNENWIERNSTYQNFTTCYSNFTPEMDPIEMATEDQRNSSISHPENSFAKNYICFLIPIIFIIILISCFVYIKLNKVQDIETVKLSEY